MEESIKTETVQPHQDSRVESAIRSVDIAKENLLIQIEHVQKRKPSSYLKRGKADLAFLKGSHFLVICRNGRA